MIVYGSGNGDGNRHNHNNLPFILAGRGGGSLSPGRYLKLKAQPMSNLYPQHARSRGRPRRSAPRRFHRALRGDLTEAQRTRRLALCATPYKRGGRQRDALPQ